MRERAARSNLQPYGIIHCQGEMGVGGKTKAQRAAALGLPGDVVLGDVLVSFIGNRSVYIENYRNILFYTDALIRIQAKNCRVEITGDCLQIAYFTGEAMKVTGNIRRLEFL